jgi:hypothetical protein
MKASVVSCRGNHVQHQGRKLNEYVDRSKAKEVLQPMHQAVPDLDERKEGSDAEEPWPHGKEVGCKVSSFFKIAWDDQGGLEVNQSRVEEEVQEIKENPLLSAGVVENYNPPEHDKKEPYIDRSDSLDPVEFQAAADLDGPGEPAEKPGDSEADDDGKKDSDEIEGAHEAPLSEGKPGRRTTQRAEKFRGLLR